MSRLVYKTPPITVFPIGVGLLQDPLTGILAVDGVAPQPLTGTMLGTDVALVLRNTGTAQAPNWVPLYASQAAIQPWAGSSSSGTTSSGPTTLVSFAGTAGAPTGHQIATSFNGTAAINATLDGNGNLAFDGSDAIGVLFGLGAQPDGLYTFNVNLTSSTNDVRVILRASGTGSNMSGYVVWLRVTSNDSTPAHSLAMLPFVNGALQPGGAPFASPIPTPTENFSIRMAGSTFTFFVDGTQVASTTDTTITAAGSIGLGTTSGSFSSITYTA